VEGVGLRRRLRGPDENSNLEANMRRLLSSTAAAVILLAAGGVSAATAPTTAGSKGATFATVTTQLPRTVRPSHYDLAFTPDAAS
jgi:aminopeptidase N